MPLWLTVEHWLQLNATKFLNGVELVRATRRDLKTYTAAPLRFDLHHGVLGKPNRAKIWFS